MIEVTIESGGKVERISCCVLVLGYEDGEGYGGMARCLDGQTRGDMATAAVLAAGAACGFFKKEDAGDGR